MVCARERLSNRYNYQLNPMIVRQTLALSRRTKTNVFCQVSHLCWYLLFVAIFTFNTINDEHCCCWTWRIRNGSPLYSYRHCEGNNGLTHRIRWWRESLQSSSCSQVSYHLSLCPIHERKGSVVRAIAVVAHAVPIHLSILNNDEL